MGVSFPHGTRVTGESSLVTTFIATRTRTKPALYSEDTATRSRVVRVINYVATKQRARRVALRCSQKVGLINDPRIVSHPPSRGSRADVTHNPARHPCCCRVGALNETNRRAGRRGRGRSSCSKSSSSAAVRAPWPSPPVSEHTTEPREMKKLTNNSPPHFFLFIYFFVGGDVLSRLRPPPARARCRTSPV